MYNAIQIEESGMLNPRWKLEMLKSADEGPRFFTFTRSRSFTLDHTVLHFTRIFRLYTFSRS